MNDEIIMNNICNKEKLKNIYDVCNRIFKDKQELFYSSDEVEEMKKNKENKFI